MKLYVCYDFFKGVRTTGRPGGHPCGNAYHALRDAGHEPEIVAVHGVGLPLLDKTKGRAEVEAMTGQRMVPVLVTDDGETIRESKVIAEWAQAHPASAA